MLTQVDQTPGTDPIALGLRPVQNVGLERRLLTRVELFRATRAGPVMQTVRSLDIEALDRIVQGLALHAGQAGGFGPGHALERIGNRQEPQSSSAVLLMGCTRAQVGW